LALPRSKLASQAPGDTWRPWRILLIALMGEALTDDERIVFKELTGRDHEAGFRCEEFVAVIGRRGGKSRAMAALALHLMRWPANAARLDAAIADIEAGKVTEFDPTTR
jgi:hypothetical protein